MGNGVMTATTQMQGHAVKQAWGSDNSPMGIPATIETEIMAAWLSMFSLPSDTPVKDKRFKDSSRTEDPIARRMSYGYRTARKYPASADDFLAQSQQHAGFWRPHWGDWIESHDNKMLSAGKQATKVKYKAVAATPGSYVKAT